MQCEMTKSEQRTLRSTLAHWKLKLQEQDGTNIDLCNMQKRVGIARTKSNVDSTRRDIKFKIEETKDEWEKNIKRIKIRKEEESLVTQEKEFDTENEDDLKWRNKNLKSSHKGRAKGKTSDI